MAAFYTIYTQFYLATDVGTVMVNMLTHEAKNKMLARKQTDCLHHRALQTSQEPLRHMLQLLIPTQIL